MTLIAIPIERLEPSRHSPRSNQRDSNLHKLATSIAELGILTPLIVCRDPDHRGLFMVIDGSRRLLAARLLQTTGTTHQQKRVATLPCIVRDTSPEDAYLMVLEDNLSRKPMTRRDAMKGFRRLHQEFGWSISRIARSTGRSRGDISELLGVANDPDLAPLVESGRITPTMAQHVRRLPSGLRHTALEGIRQGHLTTIRDIRGLPSENTFPSAPFAHNQRPDMEPSLPSDESATSPIDTTSVSADERSHQPPASFEQVEQAFQVLMDFIRGSELTPSQIEMIYDMVAVVRAARDMDDL